MYVFSNVMVSFCTNQGILFTNTKFSNKLYLLILKNVPTFNVLIFYMLLYKSCMYSHKAHISTDFFWFLLCKHSENYKILA